MNDYQIDPATADYVFSDGRIALCSDLGNRVYLALATERGSVLGQASFGSRLHQLKRSKAVGSSLASAVDMAREALAYLVQDGSARSVEVSGAWLADTVRKGVLLTIRVDQVVGTAVFRHFVPVA